MPQIYFRAALGSNSSSEALYFSFLSPAGEKLRGGTMGMCIKLYTHKCTLAPTHSLSLSFLFLPLPLLPSLCVCVYMCPHGFPSAAPNNYPRQQMPSWAFWSSPGVLFSFGKGCASASRLPHQNAHWTIRAWMQWVAGSWHFQVCWPPTPIACHLSLVYPQRKK